jgi:hypothetical protein
LLKPHKVFLIDVGPERARRKGYMRAQFERLFQPRSRADGKGGDHA